MAAAAAAAAATVMPGARYVFCWGWKDLSRHRNSVSEFLCGGCFCVYLFLSFAQ